MFRTRHQSSKSPRNSPRSEFHLVKYRLHFGVVADLFQERHEIIGNTDRPNSGFAI